MIQTLQIYVAVGCSSPSPPNLAAVFQYVIWVLFIQFVYDFFFILASDRMGIDHGW